VDPAARPAAQTVATHPRPDAIRLSQGSFRSAGRPGQRVKARLVLEPFLEMDSYTRALDEGRRQLQAPVWHPWHDDHGAKRANRIHCHVQSLPRDAYWGRVADYLRRDATSANDPMTRFGPAARNGVGRGRVHHNKQHATLNHAASHSWISPFFEGIPNSDCEHRIRRFEDLQRGQLRTPNGIEPDLQVDAALDASCPQKIGIAECRRRHSGWRHSTSRARAQREKRCRTESAHWVMHRILSRGA